MNPPIWFSIASTIFLAVVAVTLVRYVVDMRRRMKSGEIKPEDDWDPFA
jgi:hypothetical protein